MTYHCWAALPMSLNIAGVENDLPERSHTNVSLLMILALMGEKGFLPAHQSKLGIIVPCHPRVGNSFRTDAWR